MTFPVIRQVRASVIRGGGAEFLMMAPAADKVVPMFHPQLTGEPVPVNGRLKLPDRPGFGVELNRSVALHRPYNH